MMRVSVHCWEVELNVTLLAPRPVSFPPIASIDLAVLDTTDQEEACTHVHDDDGQAGHDERECEQWDVTLDHSESQEDCAQDGTDEADERADVGLGSSTHVYLLELD